MKHLKWFLTKHGLLVLCMLLGVICSMLWYFTDDITVNHVFYYIMWAFFTPPALYALLSILVGIPVNMIRGKDTGRENWPIIKQWTTLQMWFNRPWTPYNKK